jgi:hypothetical protein
MTRDTDTHASALSPATPLPGENGAHQQPRPGVVIGQPVLAAQREAARTARRNPTAAEARAWELLRGRQVLGLKFRREQVVNGVPDASPPFPRYLARPCVDR